MIPSSSALHESVYAVGSKISLSLTRSKSSVTRIFAALVFQVVAFLPDSLGFLELVFGSFLVATPSMRWHVHGGYNCINPICFYLKLPLVPRLGLV